MSFTQIAVTGTFKKEDGSAASGRVEFQLTQTLQDPASNEFRARVPIVAVLNGSGTISVSLAATNDPGITPTGARYTVTEKLTTAPQRSYDIEIPYNGGALDLADAPVLITPPVLYPQIGWYLIGLDTLAFATGGIERVRVTPSGLSVQDGSVGVPPLFFTSETDLGFFRIGAGLIGVADGGAEIMRLAFGGAGYPVDVAAAEADGAAMTPARSDHVHAHGSGYLADAHHAQLHASAHAEGGADEIIDGVSAPSTQAFGDAAAVGADTAKAAPRLHKHAMPVDPVTAHEAAGNPHPTYETSAEAQAKVDAHTGDTSDAHDASAISILDAGGDFTATDVEGALDEIQADNEAHVVAADPHAGYRLESVAIAAADVAADVATQAELDSHAAAADPHTDYLKESAFTTKGDTVAATAASTPARVAVGANGLPYIADSASTPGVKWGATDGSAGVGGLAPFTAEPTSNWFRVGAGILGLAILGVERLRLSATELLVSTSVSIKGPRPWADLRGWGAKGDADIAVSSVGGSAITVGTPDLTNAVGVWTVADVGKMIGVVGAGAAGAVLGTTILAFVSPTAVTLAANAGTTVGAAATYWGTDDTTAIQNAINALPTAGGWLYGSSGHYGISQQGANAYCLNFTNAIKFTGVGGGTVFVVGPTPGTVDAFRLAPATDGYFWHFADFVIRPLVPNTGPGRHAMYLDVNAGALLLKLNIERVFLMALGGRGIVLNNPSDTGALTTSRIKDCVVQNGIELINCLDSVEIIGTTITGANCGIVYQCSTGAAIFNVEDCNITSSGGAIWIKAGNGVRITGNNIETTQALSNGGTGESGNSALVDLDGAAITISGAFVNDNCIICLAPGDVDLIRANLVAGARFGPNRLATVVGRTGIRVKANATGTRIDSQMKVGAGTEYVNEGDTTFGYTALAFETFPGASQVGNLWLSLIVRAATLQTTHASGAVGMQIGSATTGNAAIMQAIGSDTNINVDVRGKGLGVLDLLTNRANYFELQGSSAAAANISMYALGSDANIGIRFLPKGTGGVEFPNGAVGTPSHTFNGDTDTGMYRVGANDLGLSVAAGLVFEIKDAAAVKQIGFFGIGPAARAAALTQTYATADRTHAAETAVDLATTAATQTTPWGFASAAQADALATEFNKLRTDLRDLKQFVNSIADDLQAYGLEQ